MAFKWITKYDSPNYTPASKVQATWGRKRTVEAIAIHWWGDPKNKPTFQGVINWLCNKASGSSAHIVATGTKREVACLVNLSDASWATNSANPYTISIECDPRARDSDYDVIGEVIAQLRSIYGNIPLVPHKQFVETACPGVYDLARLNRVAATKKVSKSDAWGKVSNKDTVTTKTETKTQVVKFGKVTKEESSLPKGQTKVQTKGVNGVRTIKYTVTYTNGKETKRVKASDTITKAPVNEVTLVGTYVAPKPEPKPPVEQPESPQEPSQPENGNDTQVEEKGLLQSLIRALKPLWDYLVKLWNAKY